ncbi:hypothetical protein B0J11DRAFT_274570 [Dendryphion nanum]|uniref:Uncharacterized protein n=1 Tax=Dendryphion nanum TaxID=256645 RepID=A0A9P9DY41_9PLEO|nr:hypothetical protein B0J11DRAFT_274570 [Dendryphion nanum]
MAKAIQIDLERHGGTSFPFASTTPNNPLHNDCFFKVIDLHADNGTMEYQRDCFSNTGLTNFYSTIPTQSENTIRIILDGRQRRTLILDKPPSGSFSDCTSSLSTSREYETPPQCPLYKISAGINGRFRYYHIPTLRQLWDNDSTPMWFGMYSFAPHIQNCSMFRGILNPLQSTYERSDVYLTVCRDGEGRMTVVCYAPDAYTSICCPDCDRECANANQRYLLSLDIALQKMGRHWGSESWSSRQALLCVFLTVFETNLKQTADFLDYGSVKVDEEDWDVLPKDTCPIPESRLVAILSERILIFRAIEDAITNISHAITYTSNSLESTIPIPQSLQTLISNLSQDSQHYTRWSTSLKTRSIEVHSVVMSRFNVRQANSATQLTTLAAFFLPLTLAAGILSMQTRFSDLHLLLYDFLGVVIILATLAIIFAALNRHCKEGFKTALLSPYGIGKGWSGKRSWAGYLRLVVLVLWWLATLASFLVGMVKEVIFGLKVFGFAALGIVAFGWGSYGIYVGWIVYKSGVKRKGWDEVAEAIFRG